MGMLNKILTLIVLTLLFGTTLKGAEIRFTATEYAGSSFTFYTVPNFLTDKQEIIAEGVVDEKGEFKAEIKVESTIPVYSEFGVYKGWFVADPNVSYELILPPKEEKKSSNPYFKPIPKILGIKNPSPESTNLLVDNFMRQYNFLMNRNMNQIFYRRSLETSEKVIDSLKLKFPETNNLYFEQFKTYKYAYIKYMALIQDPAPVIQEFFVDKPILYHHPEYSELFDKLFTKYLQYATQQVDGQKTSVMLNSGSYDQLLDWLTLDMGFDVPLSEAIILKGIKPLFYSKKFNTVGLFNLLQKITDTSELAIHQTTSNKVFNELARTMYGALAPELSLLDTNGNIVGWENFEGKYVYLCFTRSDNEKFIPHKDLMKEFYQKYKDNLALVIVIEDEDFEKNAEALKATGFEWTVLRGMSRREVYESFNVRIMPTYFLIDPQGRLAGSQAPWPDENFEMQFANILKSAQSE
jgi:peroxiredoxin